MKRFEGKLFGAALGFTFGGPIGALIGAAIGHFVDSSSPGKVVYGKQAQKELAFITSLILLLTGIARADGEVTPQEVQTIKRFFREQLGYRGAEYTVIERIINESIHRKVNLEETCWQIKSRATYEERLFLVSLGYQVALSDGWLRQEEEKYIQQASFLLDIEEYDYVMIKNTYRGYRETGGYQRNQSVKQEALEPYQVLGVVPTCSNEELQKAYRNMASKYHPDKVSHLGKEFIDLANKKFTQIQEAYQRIKVQRGLN